MVSLRMPSSKWEIRFSALSKAWPRLEAMDFSALAMAFPTREDSSPAASSPSWILASRFSRTSLFRYTKAVSPASPSTTRDSMT